MGPRAVCMGLLSVGAVRKYANPLGGKLSEKTSSAKQSSKDS